MMVSKYEAPMSAENMDKRRTIMALDVADHMLRDRCHECRMDGMPQSADALQKDRDMLAMLRGRIMDLLLAESVATETEAGR